MTSTNGYIYVRNHTSYAIDDACKMGKANNIPERDTQYATGEILVKQLENEIENNKRVAHQFIKGIVKTQIQTDEKEEKYEKEEKGENEEENEETKEPIIELKPKLKARRVKKPIEEKEEPEEEKESVELKPKPKARRVKKTD